MNTGNISKQGCSVSKLSSNLESFKTKADSIKRSLSVLPGETFDTSQSLNISHQTAERCDYIISNAAIASIEQRKVRIVDRVNSVCFQLKVETCCHTTSRCLIEKLTGVSYDSGKLTVFDADSVDGLYRYFDDANSDSAYLIRLLRNERAITHDFVITNVGCEFNFYQSMAPIYTMAHWLNKSYHGRFSFEKNLKNYENFVNFYEQLVAESKDRVLGKNEKIFIEKRKDAFDNSKLCLECYKQSMDSLNKILADSVINRPMKQDAFRNYVIAPLIKCVQKKNDSSFLDIFSVPKKFLNIDNSSVLSLFVTKQKLIFDL